MDIATILVLVAGIFLGTNLDNLLLLVVMLGLARQDRGPILLGYLLAVLLVLCLALAAHALGAFVEPRLLGYAGLLPLAMGVAALWRRDRGAATGGSIESGFGGKAPALSALGVVASNSGDSVAALLPLVAESSSRLLGWIIGAYLLLALALAAIALAIAGRENLARAIERRGARLVPWLMIAAGVYILLDTGTDTLG